MSMSKYLNRVDMEADSMTLEKVQELLDRATPGPWKVCEATIHGRKYGGCWVEGPDVDDGDGMPRGVLIPISGTGGAMSYTTRLVDRQDHDHNDANARLIAAAPDLARAYIAQAKRIEAADRLAEAGDAMIDCHDGRAEAKRPDIWQRLLQRFAAALTAYEEAGK